MRDYTHKIYYYSTHCYEKQCSTRGKLWIAYEPHILSVRGYPSTGSLNTSHSHLPALYERQRVERDSDDTVTTERSKRRSERHTVLYCARVEIRKGNTAISARSMLGQRQPSYKLTSPLLLSPLQLVQRPNARAWTRREIHQR